MSTPNITPSEWEVMKLLWRKSPQTSAEVVKTLSETTSWTPKTIRTLFNRLVAKDALAFEQVGRVYYYSPIVEEKDCALAEALSFLQRIYDGAFESMLANFLDAQVLSEAEIEKLKQIIDEKGKK